MIALMIIWIVVVRDVLIAPIEVILALRSLIVVSVAAAESLTVTSTLVSLTVASSLVTLMVVAASESSTLRRESSVVPL